MTDRDGRSDAELAMSLASFSDDALLRELERRRRAERDRVIAANRVLATMLDKLFAEHPATATVAGVNLQGEFGTALKNPEDYSFQIMAVYAPEKK